MLVTFSWCETSLYRFDKEFRELRVPQWLPGFVGQKVLLGHIGDVVRIVVFGEQVVERLIFGWSDIFRYRLIPFLRIGKYGVDVENNTAKGINTVSDDLSDREFGGLHCVCHVVSYPPCGVVRQEVQLSSPRFLRQTSSVIFTMSDIIGLVLPFFGLIFIGFIAARLSNQPIEALGWMNVFIVYIALPALFFQLVGKTPFEQLGNWSYILGVVGATYAIFTIMFLISWLSSGRDIASSTIKGLAASYGNIGYMAPGLVLLAFGPEAAVPVALIFCFENVIHFAVAQ